MQVIEKNSLFAQVSGEQSAVVSGGAISQAAGLTLAIFLQDGTLTAIEALGVAFVNLF
ncbi:hypothetical protein U9R62_04100 [Cylindrospermopsis raciborskii DSH]|uniref:hypothetical protein n=1 Tax=Cylindrospermopsis raciborskii TaxID=77022 RepID=UPI002EDA27A6